MTEVRNKRVTVAGLGRFGGGIEVTRWLVEQGASVLVTDKAPAEKLAASIKQLDGLPVEFRLGEHRREDFTSADLVVASPAIERSNEYLLAANVAGVPVTTEIRLFVERCPPKVVGVTGSKGKSTTTAMLGAMLRSAFTVWVGGNIGSSLLGKLPQIKASDLVVLELSSYMLDYLGDVEWSPHVALITMLTADHLEWHGSAEAYLDAKKNIVRFQSPEDFAILPAHDEVALSWAEETSAQIATYPNPNAVPFELTLPGSHNQSNAHGAFAAARALGVEFDAAQAAVRNFTGLPHRLQLVHETAAGVRYFNDSIATIPEAAIAAVKSFPPRRVIQIVGGSDKGLPMHLLTDGLLTHAKAALCIGALGPSLATAMEQAGNATIEIRRSGDLATAIKHANEIAHPGDVVLLSPGCASYDQFVNFEQRGEMFAMLARDSDVR